MSSMPCSLTFLVLPRGPPMATIAAWCFSTHAFQAAIPSCIFVCRASSERAFQAVIRALVLLPRKMARNVSFVLITPPFFSGHSAMCLLKKLPAVVAKPVRSIKLADRDPVRDDGAEVLRRGPDMQMECWRLNNERRRQTRVEIERNGMIGRRAYCGGCAGEACDRRTVHMSRSDQPRAAMPLHNGGKLRGIAQILHIHMLDPGG